ncbi:MAG TPA: DUF6597 domain-containing transcriptional factor [Thermoanaerobaculia bacterium]|nr:DUF6597 domain-containing transcriptional factor [Thermoanaerobaculia bacterium]
MPYVAIVPSPALQPWVECFWTVRGEPAGERRILPDGCADLVFDRADGAAIAVGTMTKPLLFTSRAGADYLGVRFHPGRAAAFLRMTLAEITDARVPLADVWKGWRDDRYDVAMLERELLRRLVPERDRRVDVAIARIMTSGGNARVEDVAAEAGVTRQHLARQFLHHVGVSPKTFARVMRFRRVLERTQADADWADVAAEHGYYDQSHLIAEFRELAGTTPAAFHFSNR